MSDLGPTQKALLRLVVDGGWQASATRTYPHPWRWTLNQVDAIGVRELAEAMVSAWVEAGAGVVTDLKPFRGTERRVFEPDAAGADAALARVKPRGPDPDQLNWIPADDPSMRRVKPSGEAA